MGKVNVVWCEESRPSPEFHVDLKDFDVKKSDSVKDTSNVKGAASNALSIQVYM